MCRTEDASAALMPLAMVIVVFMCLFLGYSFRRESLEYNYEQIDSNSLLAAAIINFNEYAVSGNLIISDGTEPEVWDSAFINSYIRFTDCLKCNLGLDENMCITKGQGMEDRVNIISYRVYNYLSDENGWHVTECGIKDGQPYTLRYPDNVHVYVAANDGMIRIEQTSIYAQISFRLDKLGEYCMTRLVAVTD